MSDTLALVVIDVQTGLIEGFEEDWSDVLPVISGLVFRARDDGVPVVLVQHCGSTPAHPLHRNQLGWALHPASIRNLEIFASRSAGLMRFEIRLSIRCCEKRW